MTLESPLIDTSNEVISNTIESLTLNELPVNGRPYTIVNSGPLIGAGTSTDELTLLPADAIQEVNVMANASAEFGWFQGGGQRRPKSGTNAIHGSACAFGRNNSLEAYNPYQNGITPALPKADDNFEQYGASFGGPIRRDKLFYFGNYEGMRLPEVTAARLRKDPDTSSR